MSLEETAERVDFPEDMDKTVADLVNMYGLEEVRRGLSYMKSLSEAEDNFKSNVSSEQMQEGYDEAGVEGDTSEVSSHWAEQAKESGLGLEDE